MIVFASDLRNNGIPLIVGMYKCNSGDHWHINAIDITPGKDPRPLDVLLSAEKIPNEAECCKTLAKLIQDFDPLHEEVDTLVFQAYDLNRASFDGFPPEREDVSEPYHAALEWQKPLLN